jgi:hypothetical protein
MIHLMSRSPETSLGPPDLPQGLTPDQQQWALRSEALWQRAHAIAKQHPESDVSDFHHALRCLQLTPTQRLAAGLQRGRLRAHAR